MSLRAAVVSLILLVAPACAVREGVPDASSASDAASVADVGSSAEVGPASDAGPAVDAGPGSDAGTGTDATPGDAAKVDASADDGPANADAADTSTEADAAPTPQDAAEGCDAQDGATAPEDVWAKDSVDLDAAGIDVLTEDAVNMDAVTEDAAGDAPPSDGTAEVADSVPDVADTATEDATSAQDAIPPDDAAPADAPAPDALAGASDAPDADDAGAAEDVDEAAPPSPLISGCWGWPDVPFSPDNHAIYGLNVDAGIPAIPFTLRDLDGTPHALKDLLAQRPVVIVTGSLTCDIYQKGAAWFQDLAGKYAGKVWFVLIYTVEAHPKLPDVSPYDGYAFKSGVIPQPLTYDERVAAAKQLDQVQDMLVLVDDLQKDAVNPFWCTYGSVPNGGFVMRKDGTLTAALPMAQDPSFELAIQQVLAAP